MSKYTTTRCSVVWFLWGGSVSELSVIIGEQNMNRNLELDTCPRCGRTYVEDNPKVGNICTCCAEDDYLASSRTACQKAQGLLECCGYCDEVEGF